MNFNLHLVLHGPWHVVLHAVLHAAWHVVLYAVWVWQCNDDKEEVVALIAHELGKSHWHCIVFVSFTPSSLHSSYMSCCTLY
ncbi:unnamed protein product, partial [Closterium sp. NIES-53]